jgi:integrase
MYGQPEPARAVSQKSREFAWLVKDKGDAAIRAIWSAADAIGGDEGRWLKLVMITGKRRTAVERIRWEDIAADWYWTPRRLQGGREVPFGTHIKRCHPIPLPPLAQRVLGKRGDVGRVFEGLSHAVTVMRRVRELTGLEDFIFHALRHLAETKCAELGIQPHIRDMLFDHSPGRRRGSGKGYDHADYLAERTEALKLWAGHIERATAPAEGVAVLR